MGVRNANAPRGLLLFVPVPLPLPSSLVSLTQSLWISTCTHPTEHIPTDLKCIRHFATLVIATVSTWTSRSAHVPTRPDSGSLHPRLDRVTTELMIVSMLEPIRVSICPHVTVLASTLGGNGGVLVDTTQYPIELFGSVGLLFTPPSGQPS